MDGYLQVNACVWVCSNLHFGDLKRDGNFFIFLGFFSMFWVFLLGQYFDVFIVVNIFSV